MESDTFSDDYLGSALIKINKLKPGVSSISIKMYNKEKKDIG